MIPGIDESESSWQIRQRDRDDFQPDSFRTIELRPGVRAIVGNLKPTVEDVRCKIRQSDGQWGVYTPDGAQGIGTFGTWQEAWDFEQQIDALGDAWGLVYRQMPEHTMALARSVGSIAHTWRELGVQITAADSPHNQPETALGSVEDLLARGRVRADHVIEGWLERFEAAVAGQSEPLAIFNAINRTQQELSVSELAAAMRREMEQAIALGALDGAALARTLDETAEPVDGEVPLTRQAEVTRVASTLRLIVGEVFSEMPHERAMGLFQERNVVSRASFNRLSALARQRAFTVSGVLGKQMLRTVHAELVKQVGAKADMRQFGKFMRERVIGAGFLPPSLGSALGTASHVETVFRTNVLGAYNAGRHAQMSEPAVLAARPVWEIRAINDPPRVRHTHLAANGVRLLASDPFWQRAYPPFGFNCFMPETIVQGTMLGASRAVYAGKAVQLTTAKGRRLTVTAKHPVLTAKGLAPADAIREGDQVVCYIGEPGVQTLRPGTERDEDQHPSTAENVFGALAQSGLGRLAFCGADDFHGEAKRFRGEIQVVGSYLDLLRHAQVASAEHVGERVFMPPAMRQTPATGLRPFGLDGGRIRLTSSGTPRLAELPFDRGPVALRPLDRFGGGPAAQFDATLGQRPDDDLTADAAFARELLDRSAGEVSLDEVVQVRQFDSVGHVYDLETATGWILAGGIVTGNCRCRVVSRPGSATGVTHGTDPRLSGLPDPGFTSGVASLVGMGPVTPGAVPPPAPPPAAPVAVAPPPPPLPTLPKPPKPPPAFVVPALPRPAPSAKSLAELPLTTEDMGPGPDRVTAMAAHEQAAKQASNAVRPLLVQPQIDAVDKFTAPGSGLKGWKVISKADAAAVQKKTVNGERARAINEAIAVAEKRAIAEKLKPVTLYRGIGDLRSTEIMQSFLTKDTITFDRMSSWTTKPWIARGFAAKGDGRIIFKVATTRGLPVASMSRVPKECETILPKNVKYRVIKRERMVVETRPFLVLHLQEIP